MIRKNDGYRQQIAQLKYKNRNISDKLKRKSVSLQREEARFTMKKNTTITVKKSQKSEWRQNKIKDNFRARDPVDLFVFDPVIKVHVQVLEYHKPADYVDLNGRNLYLWDKMTGLYHSFYIKMGTYQVSNYDVDEPLKPDRLCDHF